jgi:pilus assembly protein Flp/PilA
MPRERLRLRLAGLSTRQEDKMIKQIRRLIADERGATAIEYGLIAALVSVAGIASLQAMGTSLSGLFGKVSSGLSTVATTP